MPSPRRTAIASWTRWLGITPFDIRQLRYAIGAADHGSFNRAARALHIEQSKLSRNIMKLEHAVGMPIFERTVRESP